MKVYIKHIGTVPTSPKPYVYRIFTEMGHADIIHDEVYTNITEVDMPDELWTEGSGWLRIACIKCDTCYNERSRPGFIITCPVCGEPYLVKDTDELLSSYVEDD